MKDYYPEYIKIKAKHAKLLKTHQSLISRFQTERIEYKKLISQLSNEIRRSKGYKTYTDDDDIYHNIAHEFGVSRLEIHSPLRNRLLVNIRHALFYHYRNNKNMTTTAIGEMFNRDHSSVINGCNNVKSWLDHPKMYQNELNVLKVIQMS